MREHQGRAARAGPGNTATHAAVCKRQKMQTSSHEEAALHLQAMQAQERLEVGEAGSELGTHGQSIRK